jgi:hypothetical protein
VKAINVAATLIMLWWNCQKLKLVKRQSATNTFRQLSGLENFNHPTIEQVMELFQEF